MIIEKEYSKPPNQPKAISLRPTHFLEETNVLKAKLRSSRKLHSTAVINRSLVTLIQIYLCYEWFDDY